MKLSNVITMSLLISVLVSPIFAFGFMLVPVVRAIERPDCYLRSKRLLTDECIKLREHREDL